VRPVTATIRQSRPVRAARFNDARATEFFVWTLHRYSCMADTIDLSDKNIKWLEPWEPLPEAKAAFFEHELRLEVIEGHSLWQKEVRVIARRVDRDDVLFAYRDEGGWGCAVVHLTWRGQAEYHPNWPASVLFGDIQEWAERGMAPDHEDYFL